jgi:hypothetical protein
MNGSPSPIKPPPTPAIDIRSDVGHTPHPQAKCPKSELIISPFEEAERGGNHEVERL